MSLCSQGQLIIVWRSIQAVFNGLFFSFIFVFPASDEFGFFFCLFCLISVSRNLLSMRDANYFF